MNRVIRWEEPPSSPHGGTRKRAPRPEPWTEVIADLIDNVGKWAVVYEGNNGQACAMANNIRVGQGPWGVDSFESCARKGPDGVSRVYVRCVPGGES